MSKFLYILLGLILVGGAAGAFGVRQLGWNVPGLSSLERGHGAAAPRSATRGLDRTTGDRGDRRGRDGGSWFTFANVLDILNVVVGIVGIVLTVSGMRMQRNAMTMTMRGRD